MAGFATVMVGAPRLKDGGDARVVAWGDIVGGGAALFIGLDALIGKASSPARSTAAIRVTPIVGIIGSRPAGVLVSARF